MNAHVETFEAWRRETHPLCEAGHLANAWLSELYEKREELSLFVPASEAARAFTALASTRARYWESRPRSAFLHRLSEWCDALERDLARAAAAGDRFTLWRHWAWGALSTLPLAQALAPDAPGAQRRLEQALAPVEPQVRALPRELQAGIYWVGHTESSEAFVARRGKFITTNTYRVEDAGGRPPRVVELVEAWQFGDPAKLTLCVPLATGCPNSCAMCDFGLYYGGALAPAQVLRLIELNFEMNRGLPFRFDDEAGILYFLGAGDAALYPEIELLLSLVGARYPAHWKVFSTIANDAKGALGRLVDACARSPRTGLQISLCALNEQRRAALVGTRKTVPIPGCVEALERFRSVSGRNGYVSLFLFEDDAAQPQRFLARVRELLPRSVHVTLTALQPTERKLPWAAARLEDHHRLADQLRADGYEVSVSTNDQDPEQQASCGRSDVLHQNRPHWKGEHPKWEANSG